MGHKRRPYGRYLFWLVIFAAGGAAGYYIRDHQQDEKVKQAVQEARKDFQRVGRETVERGRRAGREIKGGAEAAAREVRGDRRTERDE